MLTETINNNTKSLNTKRTFEKDNTYVSYQIIIESGLKSVLYIHTKNKRGMIEVTPVIFKKDFLANKVKDPFDLATAKMNSLIKSKIKTGFVEVVDNKKN
jgi:hypothetical protein